LISSTSPVVQCTQSFAIYDTATKSCFFS